MSDTERALSIVAEALGAQNGVGIADGMATLPAWDSLGHLRIVLGIEAALGRTLAPEEIAGIADVRTVLDLLERG